MKFNRCFKNQFDSRLPKNSLHVAGVCLLLLSTMLLWATPVKSEPQKQNQYSPDTHLEQSELELWNSPDFQRDLVLSYQSETELEPRIEPEERTKLQKVFEYIGEDDLDSATETILKVLEKDDSANAVYNFTLANIYFQLEIYDEAINHYQIAVEKHPKFRRAWKNMGLILVRRGEYEQATECLTRVVELGGQDSISFGLLGYCYSSTENYLSAESSYRMAILLDSQSLDWQMGLARCFFKQEKFLDAAVLCGQLIEKYPERGDLWLLQANAYLGLGRPLEAAQNYELVQKLGQSTDASLNMLGDIYVNEELYELAVNAYVAAMEKHTSTNPDRPLRSAKILVARGALAEAKNLIGAIESHYTDEMDMEHRKDLLKLKARFAVAEGSGEEEVRVLEEIVEIDPLDGEALILLGQHSSRSGDIEKAIFYYERAASIEKSEADARIRHAQLLVQQSKYEEALPLLKRAQAIQPRDNVQEYLEQVERVARSR